MGVLRGANLVGMSLLPLDVCPISCMAKKNGNIKPRVVHGLSWIGFERKKNSSDAKINYKRFNLILVD